MPQLPFGTDAMAFGGGGEGDMYTHLYQQHMLRGGKTPKRPSTLPQVRLPSFGARDGSGGLGSMGDLQHSLDISPDSSVAAAAVAAGDGWV